MPTAILTQSRLKALVDYNPDTGTFYWRKSGTGRRRDLRIGSRNSNGYLYVKIDYKQYRLSRLAFLYMEGAFPEHEADHKDRVRSNNAWSNLRAATSSENRKNQVRPEPGASGMRGVTWSKRARRWCARKRVDGKDIEHRFVEKADAIVCRRKLERL